MSRSPMHQHQATSGTAADTQISDIAITATDGLALAASLFAPQRALAAEAPLVVIAPGAAIRRRFYRHFAAHVAQRGCLALTFDPRDIGDSLTTPIARSQTRMRDWCLKDVAGVIDWSAAQHPRRPLLWVGHSMGGFATGLAHNHARIARQLCIATLSGYWGGMAFPESWRVLTMMGGFAPLVVATRGFMPGALMGGEDMPGPAFMEWRGWCMHPDFLFGDATLSETARFAAFTAPVRFLQISDDPWGTMANVSGIAARFTGSRDSSLRTVTPSDAGVRRIGHFGFFRPEMKGHAWEAALTWLLEGQDQSHRSSVGA